MAKIIRIFYREMPMSQPQGDQHNYDKLYDLYFDGEKPKLRAGSKEYDISVEDFDGLVHLCEEIGAADRLDANNPLHMRIQRFSGAGSLGRYNIVFDDGSAACADFGPQEIAQRFKDLEKKYTPAGEPVPEGAWTCSECGTAGNTGKFCMECGARCP